MTLINPEDFFSHINIEIHGIDEEMVLNAPLFPDVLDKLKYFMQGSVCVCHTHFDRVSLAKAFYKYGISPLDLLWLDSARVVRRAWIEFAWKGYGLANICRKIGYEFKHHDALEDAKAAAQVLLAVIKESSLDLNDWLIRVKQPINLENSSSGPAVQRVGNPEGELCGTVLVFTGALQISRKDAADMAAKIGCNVASGITKETTLLVVGDQDITKLAGRDKSNKHLKAEMLISKGQNIRIIKESDFIDLVSSATLVI